MLCILDMHICITVLLTLDFNKLYLSMYYFTVLKLSVYFTNKLIDESDTMLERPGVCTCLSRQPKIVVCWDKNSEKKI